MLKTKESFLVRFNNLSMQICRLVSSSSRNYYWSKLFNSNRRVRSSMIVWQSVPSSLTNTKYCLRHLKLKVCITYQELIVFLVSKDTWAAPTSWQPLCLNSGKCLLIFGMKHSSLKKPVSMEFTSFMKTLSNKTKLFTDKKYISNYSCSKITCKQESYSSQSSWWGLVNYKH